MSGSETISMQRHAGAVEIHAAVAVEMRELAHVFFEMRAGDADFAHAICGTCAAEFKFDKAVLRRGLVVLRELVIFRRVGIEITFAVELREARDFAVQKKTRQHREAQRLVIRHGQHAGHSETNRADIRVRLGTILVRAAAPHLGFCFKLDVRFQPDDGFVFHCADILATDETRMKHRFFISQFLDIGIDPSGQNNVENRTVVHPGLIKQLAAVLLDNLRGDGKP